MSTMLLRWLLRAATAGTRMRATIAPFDQIEDFVDVEVGVDIVRCRSDDRVELRPDGEVQPLVGRRDVVLIRGDETGHGGTSGGGREAALVRSQEPLAIAAEAPGGLEADLPSSERSLHSR